MLSLTAFFVVVRAGCAFLFNSQTDIAHCYELDLENCFREAFLVSSLSNWAAIHPPIRGRRAAPLFHSGNVTVLDKRKADPTNLLLCHDVRRFSLCFHYPGCSEHVAAAIASVQYHMVFGKKLPLHIFLAYKGYGRQMCEQTCSRDAMLICRRAMTEEEQQQEQHLIMEATTIAQSFNFGSEDTCDNFRRSLAKLVRFRNEFCGDLSRCTCSEARWEAPSVRCAVDCERMWREDAFVVDAAHRAAYVAVVLLVRMVAW
ncbi:hypothetical protein Y032_0063g3432 [Ancylostoma ceylanicum]|uniref:Uncharacterized protein n=1 Tax=Ancylostoma ceylanicum TaxID=53326 RepID=A0A016U221_9BILA|nr:hypothetical protein Y032_0063g3432 [Ancylostoma ceylanicum]